MLETPEVIINPGSIQAEIECNKDLEITLQKREFSIVGDNVYVTTSSEAPQWLLDLINGTIANAIAEGTADFDDLRENILNAIAAMNIAKNDYDSYVIKLEDAEGRLLAYVETLNATVADSVAEIVSVLVTKATPAEASALAVEAIQASINAGAIKSQLDTIKQTVATESSTRALQIDTLTSAITDENSGLAANATAVETLYTYVGIDGDLTPTGTGLLSTIEIIQKQNDGVIDTYAGTHYIKVCDANLDDGDLNQLLTNQYPYALWTPMEGSGVPTATTRVVYRDAVSSNEPIVTYTIYKDTATNLKYIYDANTSSWSAITDTEYNNYYETLRAAHVGDVYILYSIEEGVKVYNEACKFVKTAVDTTSPYNTDAEGYGWLRITDTDAQAAYMQALNAYDLADNKRRVFVGLGATTTPSVPYDQGDLWLIDVARTVNGYACKAGDILRCIESKGKVATYEQNDWVLASSYANAVAAEAAALETWKNTTYASTIATIQTQVDGKAETFYQSSIPTGRIKSINVPTNSTLDKYVGDLWKNTYVGTTGGYLGNNTEYTYTKTANGSNWNYDWTKMEVPDIVFDTIDTKKSIYSGNSLPVAVYPDVIELNDMWITGDNPVAPYVAKSIYVWNGTTWLIPVRYTDDQYAKDIENGTRQIDLSQHIDSLGWSNSISALFSDVNTINTDLTQKALEIANLDNLISVEEAARIQAILDEESARVADIALRVAEDARLDGVITAEEQNRINAVNELDYAYKEYGRIIALALADGVLTPEEQLAITTAQTAVDAAKQRLLDIENNVSTLFSDISAINTTTASQALEIANLDNAISQEESSRIQAILDEESARIQAINARIAKEALLDGKITLEEQNRIDSINAVEVAYKEYSRVVTLAIADGVLTPEEQALITAAAAEVQATKDRLLKIETNANNYSDSILDNFLVSTYSKDLLNISNQIDGVAVTYFQDNEPYSVTVGTSANSGDVWYDTNALTPTAYKFVYKVLDSDGITVISPSAWEPITNTFVLSSLEAASETKASADRSIKNYTVTPTTPYYEGDTWMQGSTGDIYVCDFERLTGAFNQADWVRASKYTDDTATVALQTGLVNGTVLVNLASATIDGSKALTTYVAEEIDKEVVIYSGTNHATQTGMKTNDIYIEKTTAAGSSGVLVDVVNTWKYNGTAWVQIGNNSNLTALADLTDGKRTIYSGSSLPVNSTLNPLKPNDLFIPTSTFTANTVIYTANEMYRYTGTFWDKATRYDEIKSLLSAQIDSKIETTYGGATPPYANQTNVPKNPRGGDYWYCDTNGSYLKGNIYKYLETTNGSNFNYTWTLSSDVSKGAFDLADKKRIIFGNAGNSVPTLAQGLALSDIWIPSSDGSTYLAGKVYKCTSITPITFVEVDYTNDEVVNGIINGTTPLDPNTITIGNTSTTFLEYLTAEIDSKVGIYSGETAPVNGQPSGVAINDLYLWFTTASKVLANGTTQVYDITRTYKYSGSVWNEITTDSNITNLADLADGKRTVFSGNTVPVGAVERDIWIPSGNNGSYIKGEIYQYLSGVWSIATKYTADIQVLSTNLQSQIDGKVDTYYQNTIPFANATNVAKKTQAGDYWYCTLTNGSYVKGKIYKYVESPNGSNYNYTWTENADVSKYVFDIADGKASIFTTASQPSAYKINDLMIVTTSSFNNGTTTFSNGVVLTTSATRTSGFVAADWVKKINDTEDLDLFVNTVYTPALATLQNQVDGSIDYYFYEAYTNVAGATSEANALDIIDNAWSTQTLREKANGNVVYFKTTDKGYWYSSNTNSWSVITDTSIMKALRTAEQARIVADSKITSYFAVGRTTAPGTPGSTLATLTDNTVIKVPYYYYNTSTNVLYEYTTAWNVVTLDSSNDHDEVKVMVVGTDNKTVDYYFYEYSNASSPKWVLRTAGGLIAKAGWAINIDSYLKDPNTGTFGGNSQLSTEVKTTSNGTVETAFEYTSGAKLIGGEYHNAGFGLHTLSGSGTTSVPYNSEFWINADKFRITNTAQTGATSPFTIDASGTTPQITFNGKVSFTNTTGSLTTAQQNAINTSNLINGAGWTDNTVANQAIANAATAQTAANNAQTTANTVQSQVNDIVSDNKFTSLEKSAIRLDWNTIIAEYDNNIATAVVYGITTEKTAYTTVLNALGKYLNANTAWTVSSPATSSTIPSWISDTELANNTSTTIVAADFRSAFSTFYTARQTLLNKITTTAKTLADNANTLAATKATLSDVATAGYTKTQAWYQTTQPSSGMVKGDIWFNTSNGNKVYTYDGTTWVVAQDTAIGVAINSAQTAQTTADGKAVVYYQSTQPTGQTVSDKGDMWVNTNANNALYIYSGSAWVIAQDYYTANQNALTAQTTADTAVTNAATANTNANNALNQLTDIANDNKLTPIEKSSVLLDWKAILGNYDNNITTATSYNITTEKTAYTNATVALGTYLNNGTAWTISSPATNSSVPIFINSTNLSTTTTIDGTTFRTNFANLYNAEQTLLNKIVIVAKTLADNAKTTADTAVTNAATANTNATNALNQLTDIASDSKLVPSEKSTVRLDWNAIIAAYDNNIATATTYGITTEKTNYINALSTLGTYLNNGTTWTVSSPATNSSVPSWIADANLSTTTTIVAATFRTNFSNLYSTLQILLNKIVANAKTLADNAQSTANTGVTNAAAAQTTANTANTLAATKATLSDVANSGYTKTQAWYQTTQPSNGMVKGDIWFDTSNGNKLYTYNGYTWLVAQDVAIGTAISSAQTAQTTADGKAIVYYQSTQPTVQTVSDKGDMWVNTNANNALYIYSGSAWVIAQDYYTANQNALTAQTTANTASTNANNALAQLTDITSDNVLSSNEKPVVIADYTNIINEQSGIDAQATSYGITTEKTAYDNAVTALTTYLNGLTSPVAWNVLTGNTTIVGTTFRTNFSNVYSTRQALLNAITAKAKTLVDTAQSSANTAVANAATAQSTADTASSNATSALNQLTDIANDNKLTSSEKSSVRLDWNSIISSYDSNITTATSYGVTTEKTTYTNALVALGTYLNNGTAWSVSSPAVNSSIPSWIADANLNVTTVINGVTFRSNFANLYSSEQILLNKISSTAKNLADAAQSTANAVNASLTNNAYWQTQVQTALDEDTTIIDGSHIATGSIWLGGNIKTYNYNWNNGFPVGFGLFSIGDTDSQEYYNIVGGKLYGATINGANIKGAVFDIATAKMQSAVDGNTGSFIPTSLTFGGGSLQSDYFYAPGYGTGYNPNRIARDSTEFLIKCVSGGSFALYYQINDSTWTAFPDCGPSNPSYITYVGRNTYSFANGKIRFKAVTTSGNTTLSLDITAPAVYVNRYKAIYTVNGTYSFVVPAGITTLEYIVYGAGGGSGANNRDGDQDSGSGGGAGGKITGSLTVTPGETLTVIVGERGYGASYHFNSSYLPNYNAQGQQISYGTGTAGNSSYLKRGGTTIATATGGQPGWQTGSGAAGGTPYVDGTNNGRGASSILYYTGAISGGTNGSGTPPNTYSGGSGYGNGGGQSTATRGTNGQNGAVLLYWELTT